VAMFGILLWQRTRVTHPGKLFIIYVAGYAMFRFFVEFVRANDTVWLGLTRPQWFLLPSLVVVGLRLGYGYRRGYYDQALRRQPVHA
ncbi:prolipoprotein diacylglyceryl transferase family protein, partial [Mycobacterium avium]|uniref:prolipoprotein diacylglyceryl transferase family protein n=1 Tax=Mycobacterium avium TaxID=1764 RepID=UPI00114D6007